MKCPICKQRAPVRDSREDDESRRRRYLCECGHRFTTVEFIVETDPTMSVKGRMTKGKRWLRENEERAREAGRNELRDQLKRLIIE